MEAIDVSPEMLTLVGTGELGEHRWPSNPVAFEVAFGEGPSNLTFHDSPTTENLGVTDEARLVLIVARDACDRVLGEVLDFSDQSSRYLPSGLNAIAVAIRDCVLPSAASTPYRLAKSIELLCEILNAHREGRFAEVVAPATLSQRDIERIAAARKLVDECWGEKLTLCQIARRCGINRSKLARGFRQLYHCTVTEALLERRLAEAQRQLLSTDLPVGLIGYRSGYNNNASFSRAFCRRFGVPPSDFRSRLVAA
ncbi:MAG: helix-turn-helix transcriptional regulator [Sphingomonas sp.]|nr:helix-turn-helix transcriptional regulator [Sphingomonas sp.]